MSELFITLDDMHSVPAWNGRSGYCARGARAFCLQHKISWEKVIADGGILASELEKTNDALALNLVKWVRDGKVQSHDWL